MNEDMTIGAMIENERLLRFTSDAPVGSTIYIEYEGRLFLVEKIRQEEDEADLGIKEIL